MRKYYAIFMAAALWGSFAVPVNARGTTKSEDTVILYTNDVHTYIDGTLSYDVIAALKAALETQYENVLLVYAGDHIQGTTHSSMDKGESINLGNGFAMFDGAVNVLDYVREDYMVLASYVQVFDNCSMDVPQMTLSNATEV
ncbi:MAG: hypothetical protein IJX63_05215 [Lachnospiraceae bacterium]|nr:hypothetical protein [Lachnospiraceae bacterium]